jgi:hypothetical protein
MKRHTNVVRFLLVFILLAAGVYTGLATREREEVRLSTLEKSTKGRNALYGAGIGAGAGLGLASIIGGVGIVACGTGIGLPAGAAAMAIAALIGGGGGAVVGAATGERKSDTIPYTVHIVEKRFPKSYPIALCSASALLGAFSLGMMRGATKRRAMEGVRFIHE